MSQPFILQPKFVVKLAVPPETVVAKLRRSIREEAFCDHAKFAGNCFDFHVEADARRFWSPHLSVQISGLAASGERAKYDGSIPEDHSELFCRFSPRPEIWTMFMAIYAMILGLTFMGTIFAYVQWHMGDRPWAILCIPIGTVIITCLHVASLIGQRLSADQMKILTDRLQRSIQRACDENVVTGPHEDFHV